LDGKDTRKRLREKISQLPLVRHEAWLGR